MDQLGAGVIKKSVSSCQDTEYIYNNYYIISVVLPKIYIVLQ